MSMELENIVANTVYLKARQGEHDKYRGRSKKWKEMLRFPHISECDDIVNQINSNFDFIVEKQPIGKTLFKQFCSSHPKYQALVEFLEDLERYEVSIDEERLQAACEIMQKYFATQPELLNMSEDHRVTIEEHVNSSRQQSLSTEKDLFGQSVKFAKDALRKHAFPAFLESMYFQRYLQWKYLERKPVSLDNFRLYRVLGKGGFGEVCACQSRLTGRMYALKRMEKKRIKKRRGERMALNEKNILEKVNSHFIVSLAYAFQGKDEVCLVLSLMNGGDLKFHIHVLGNPGLSMERAIFYAAEITCGLQHLHRLRIVFRDLKPDNILLDDYGHIRISDLGLAIEIQEGKLPTGKVGTVGYMAPEVISGVPYSFSPDWWGLGCVFYDMLDGRSPFRRPKERVRREEVERRVKEDKEVYSSRFSAVARDFCEKLLTKHVNDRLGCSYDDAEAVKAHPIFSSINFRRLEARMVDPPFVPDSRAVYCKDVLDIEQFSTAKGVALEKADREFWDQFSTGAISIPWQQEILETGVFEELNLFGPDSTPSPDLLPIVTNENHAANSPSRMERFRARVNNMVSRVKIRLTRSNSVNRKTATTDDGHSSQQLSRQQTHPLASTSSAAGSGAVNLDASTSSNQAPVASNNNLSHNRSADVVLLSEIPESKERSTVPSSDGMQLSSIEVKPSTSSLPASFLLSGQSPLTLAFKTSGPITDCSSISIDSNDNIINIKDGDVKRKGSNGHCDLLVPVSNVLYS